MNNTNAILIIDAQYDFCHPHGSLYVPGADEDMKRLAKWIKANKSKIDHIAATADSHPVNDISHPSFWEDADGKFPDPFTPITAHEIKGGKWKPRFYPEKALQYVEAIEKQGEFGHFIWPYHCLTGSKGASLYDEVFEALVDWTKEGKYYDVVYKGTHPLTEHFGIFRANVPIEGHPETKLNILLIEKLKQYQHVFIAGEAKSHCVANSLNQAIEEAPELAERFIILEDCMSDVPNLGHLGDPVYAKAKAKGIRFAKTTEIAL